MSNGNRIKILRLSHDWSQEWLAEIACLSVRTVQRIENGEQPSPKTLNALAMVFAVSIAELNVFKPF